MYRMHFRHLASLLVALFITVMFTQAQEIKGLYNSSETRDSLVILADTAYVRSKPSTSGEKMAALEAGRKVWPVQEEESQRISGFDAPWVRVKFVNSGGVISEGYIWKGLTAFGSYLRNDVRFLYGLDHGLAGADKGDFRHYFAKVRVLDLQGKPLATKIWQLNSSEATSFTEGKVFGAMGLDSIIAIARFYFTGEACAIPDDYYYFGWNGTELLSLPGKTDISDAGVFYHGEQLLFPSEKGGSPGKIIKLLEDEEVLDEVDKKGEPLTKKTKLKEVYSWDGRKAVKL
ncbi:hypothetical protein HNQ91_000997 [Filimonas zeae]|nr:SH3 domain-containing protein [Filimonas zeae]MDR6337975.1 hypothetical protein [Filimonas zeae]